MGTNRVNQSSGGTLLVTPNKITHAQTHEKTNGIIHWTRARWVGECPACHHTHNKPIMGWNKLQCENCGETWTYRM